MSFRFDSEKACHVVLFLIHSLGGSVDRSRLFLLLYLSDQQHLATHGALILGDNYMAMKYGPAPCNVLGYLRQLGEGKVKGRLKNAIVLDTNGELTAPMRYDPNQLAVSEVLCMFQVVNRCKDLSFDALSELARDDAWNKADANGNISLLQMAAAGGASDDTIHYIGISYRNELKAFEQL